jgi:hypothetical protein
MLIFVLLFHLLTLKPTQDLLNLDYQLLYMWSAQIYSFSYLNIALTYEHVGPKWKKSKKSKTQLKFKVGAKSPENQNKMVWKSIISIEYSTLTTRLHSSCTHTHSVSNCCPFNFHRFIDITSRDVGANARSNNLAWKILDSYINTWTWQ